ncbi:GNAT family N-acetyltransferase [Metabacillus halosaccharovorans]|uniref:GNAT family N-acetyltransferase n=1 Tax=Metabacillus halosaccharovorans TaxID=930124 RepID=UPI001C1F703C|nr:GNAT family N-acetyltransferase [Metabacillus halosaccharovorans]MBU7596006.1 GNAT family N-acetyltransferase [Metabacillus halosaccharovorans]
MTLYIRRMNEGDIEQVQLVAKSSWHSTYKGIIPDHIQESFVNTAYSCEMLMKRLTETLFLVAEQEGNIIGFANFTPLKDEKKVELGAIYLYEEYQGNGIGTELLKTGLEELQYLKKMYVNVEKDNQSAVSFYKSKGFMIETEYDDVFDGYTLKTVRMMLEK